MTQIGINPNEYYTNTWRENDFISKAFLRRQEEDLRRTRRLEWRIVTMAGKSMKGNIDDPRDLYTIGELEQKKTTVLEGEQAESFLKEMFK